MSKLVINTDTDATQISNKNSKTVTGTEEVLVNDGGTLKKTTAQDIADLGGGGGGSEYIMLEHQETSGTHAGTATSGSWQTLPINTEVYDTGSNCSLSSNQFTLDSGTYRFKSHSPFRNVSKVKTRLYNVTDSTTELTSDSREAAQNKYDTAPSVIRGIFTIASSKTFKIEYYCEYTEGTAGLGMAGGSNTGSLTEKYANVELHKTA